MVVGAHLSTIRLKAQVIPKKSNKVFSISSELQVVKNFLSLNETISFYFKAHLYHYWLHDSRSQGGTSDELSLC
jgi:hypothetical protein